MPEIYRQKLEPNTSTIQERIASIHLFLEAGYEVHLNFSPVIVHDNWLNLYRGLFMDINSRARFIGWDIDDVKAEVIFLTHNEDKHLYNLQHKLPLLYLRT